MRRSVDRMQLLSQDIHWIVGMWIRCVSVRSTEQMNEIEGGVVQGRTLVFCGCGIFENSAGMYATILMALRCEVRLTTSFIAQHHRKTEARRHTARRSPAWHDMSWLGAASVDT